MDVAHRFRDAYHILPTLNAIVQAQPSLVETPLWLDGIREWGQLAQRSPIPLAGAELLESFWEYLDLMELGKVMAVQPWVNRVGITQSLRVLEEARVRGIRPLMAGWNTTAVGVAAEAHLAAGLGDSVVLEHAPVGAYGFPLRSVAGPDPPFYDGVIQLGVEPGLGVSLNEEALELYRTTE